MVTPVWFFCVCGQVSSLFACDMAGVVVATVGGGEGVAGCVMAAAREGRQRRPARCPAASSLSLWLPPQGFESLPVPALTLPQRCLTFSLWVRSL